MLFPNVSVFVHVARRRGATEICSRLCLQMSVCPLRRINVNVNEAFGMSMKRQIDHRLATHFYPAALPAQIAEVGQAEGRSQAKLLLIRVAVVGAA